MRIAGWTLIVMAVIMHFSVCEWDDYNYYGSKSCIVPFLPFVHAREQFATHSTLSRSKTTTTFNTMAAGLWGLVIPLGLAVAGIGLILRDPRPTILRRVGGWLCSAGKWLRRRAVALGAGVAVMVALLVTILLIHHSGRDVVSTPKDIPDWLTTEPPSQAHSIRGVTTAPVDWDAEFTRVLGPPPPDGSGIFQKYEQMSGEKLSSRDWLDKYPLTPESEIHEPHAWLRQRSARQWHSKNPDSLSNTITAFRAQFPNESWTKEREWEYRNFLAADAFYQIAKVAQREGSSVSVWTPADTKLGIPPPPGYGDQTPVWTPDMKDIPPPPDYKGLNSADWTPETGIPPPPDRKKIAAAPIEVEVDGFGVIEFPDGMELKEIQEVLSRKFPAAQQPTADKIRRRKNGLLYRFDPTSTSN